MMKLQVQMQMQMQLQLLVMGKPAVALGAVCVAAAPI